MKKISSVLVSWKYTSDGKKKNSFVVNFPRMVFEGKDLRGRRNWTNAKWECQALDEFEKIKGFRCTMKDVSVIRS